MKKIILFLAIFTASFHAFAQQEAMVSQYMFNGLFLNPAYSGSHKYFSSTLLHRNQWVSFDGAPKTSLIAIDGPIKNDKMGVGLMIQNDKVGVTNQTDVMLNYAYHLPLFTGKLSFGVKSGFASYNAKVNSLTVWDNNDEVFNSNVQSKLMPKFGFGMYYYTEKFYLGLSIPTMLVYDNTKNFSLDVNKASNMRRHYFINSGYVFTLNESIKVKPSVLVKYLPNAPLEVDLNCNVLFKDALWVGASLRTGDAVVAMVEYQTNIRFRVGYAYDFTYSKIRKYSAGSHEIIIGYDFGKDLAKIKTPRFF